MVADNPEELQSQLSLLRLENEALKRKLEATSSGRTFRKSNTIATRIAMFSSGAASPTPLQEAQAGVPEVKPVALEGWAEKLQDLLKGDVEDDMELSVEARVLQSALSSAANSREEIEKLKSRVQELEAQVVQLKERSPSGPAQTVLPSAWANRERKYKMDLEEYQTTIEGQKAKISRVMEELTALRQGSQIRPLEEKILAIEGELKSTQIERTNWQSKYHELSLKHRQLIETSPEVASLWQEMLVKQAMSGGGSHLASSISTPLLSSKGTLKGSGDLSSSLALALSESIQIEHLQPVGLAKERFSSGGVLMPPSIAPPKPSVQSPTERAPVRVDAVATTYAMPASATPGEVRPVFPAQMMAPSYSTPQGGDDQQVSPQVDAVATTYSTPANAAPGESRPVFPGPEPGVVAHPRDGHNEQRPVHVDAVAATYTVQVDAPTGEFRPVFPSDFQGGAAGQSSGDMTTTTPIIDYSPSQPVKSEATGPGAGASPYRGTPDHSGPQCAPLSAGENSLGAAPLSGPFGSAVVEASSSLEPEAVPAQDVIRSDVSSTPGTAQPYVGQSSVAAGPHGGTASLLTTSTAEEYAAAGEDSMTASARPLWENAVLEAGTAEVLKLRHANQELSSELQLYQQMVERMKSAMERSDLEIANLEAMKRSLEARLEELDQHARSQKAKSNWNTWWGRHKEEVASAKVSAADRESVRSIDSDVSYRGSAGTTPTNVSPEPARSQSLPSRAPDAPASGVTTPTSTYPLTPPPLPPTTPPEMKKLQEENNYLMDSLVQTKLQLAEAQGQNTQMRRSLVRAMDKETCMEVRIRELEAILDMVTSVAGSEPGTPGSSRSLNHPMNSTFAGSAGHTMYSLEELEEPPADAGPTEVSPVFNHRLRKSSQQLPLVTSEAVGDSTIELADASPGPSDVTAEKKELPVGAVEEYALSENAYVSGSSSSEGQQDDDDDDVDQEYEGLAAGSPSSGREDGTTGPDVHKDQNGGL